MSRPSPDRVPDGVARLVVALGAAWVTHQLYPDPVAQPPFVRALEAIEEAAGRIGPIEVGPGFFAYGGEQVPVEREGVEKLARRLFVHDVEYLEVVGGVDPAGLVALFDVLAHDDEEIAARGGIAAVLAGVGHTGIHVRQRGLLSMHHGGAGETLPPEELAEGLPDPARAAFAGAAPVDIAQALLAVDEDPVSCFVEAYRGIHGRLLGGPDSGHPPGAVLAGPDPYRTLRSFVEAFFHLPHAVQLRVLEEILIDVERPDHRMFLDQFSGNDLSRLLPELSEESAAALLRYAVDASNEPGGHPLDLLAGLTSAREVDEARRRVAERMTDLLRRDAAGELSVQLLDLRRELSMRFDDVGAERRAARGLFECEDRPDRFQRVARMWAGRVARAVRRGDMARAVGLLEAVLADEPFPPSRRFVVDDAIARMGTKELFEWLGGQRVDEPDLVDRFLHVAGAPLAERIVERLGEEEDRAGRRTLVELLAPAVRHRPELLAAHLSDPRWYLVRNLALVLGRTGNPSAAHLVRQVAGHADHRVRVEVLRAVARLEGERALPFLVGGLADPDEPVRHVALHLLRGTDHPRLDQLLAERLAGDALPLDAALSVVEILAFRRGAEGMAILRRLARRRFVVRGRLRALRRAARAALREAAA